MQFANLLFCMHEITPFRDNYNNHLKERRESTTDGNNGALSLSSWLHRCSAPIGLYLDEYVCRYFGNWGGPGRAGKWISHTTQAVAVARRLIGNGSIVCRLLCKQTRLLIIPSMIRFLPVRERRVPQHHTAEVSLSVVTTKRRCDSGRYRVALNAGMSLNNANCLPIKRHNTIQWMDLINFTCRNLASDS